MVKFLILSTIIKYTLFAIIFIYLFVVKILSLKKSFLTSIKLFLVNLEPQEHPPVKLMFSAISSFFIKQKFYLFLKDDQLL